MNLNQSVVNRIINQIRVAKGFSPIDLLDDGKDLRNDLGFDSFDLAELTVRIEDELGVDIFANGLITTLGQVYSIIKAN